MRDNPRPHLRVAGAAVVLLCAAAVLLAGCGNVHAGRGSRPGFTGRPATGPPSPFPGHWRVDNSGTRQRLYAVACLSTVRCEAVGAGGTILATTDGGGSWHPQPSPLRGPGTILYRIACAAPASCYVIARPDTMLVTHDGGASWASHVLPLPGAGPALTDQPCRAQVGTMSPAMCQLGLLDVGCVTASSCYAVATGPLGDSGCADPACSGQIHGPPGAPPAAIWMTTDGGATWARQPFPQTVECTAGECSGSDRFYYPLRWVSCLGSGLCRAGGETFLARIAHGWAAGWLAVAHPGAAWQAVTCPGMGHPEACGLIDAAVCVTAARCAGFMAAGEPAEPGNVVGWTNDGGLHWSGGSRGTATLLTAIACPSAQLCYTTGTQGFISQWLAPPPGPAWAGSGPLLAADGRPVTRDLFGISCPTTVICYAVGDDGTIVSRR